MTLSKLVKSRKGFTLIELLVVIAVLGILASVVLVAINPSERINEANDSGVKNDVSQVATAVESYYTNNSGDYTGANGITTALVTPGYLKLAPSGITVTVASGGASAVVYGTLSASTATCDTGTGATKYWVYRSATGVSQTECLDTAPTP